jgi:hypothetical protein
MVVMGTPAINRPMRLEMAMDKEIGILKSISKAKEPKM